MLHGERDAGSSSAKRRRDRQLPAWHRHVKLTVVELATALHHGAQPRPERGGEGGARNGRCATGIEDTFSGDSRRGALHYVRRRSSACWWRCGQCSLHGASAPQVDGKDAAEHRMCRRLLMFLRCSWYKNLGPQSPRWVLPVDVLVPRLQETTVFELLEVRAGSGSGLQRHTTIKAASLQDGEWEVKGQEEAQLLLHCDTGKVAFELRDGKTMKIVWQFCCEGSLLLRPEAVG